MIVKILRRIWIDDGNRGVVVGRRHYSGWYWRGRKTCLVLVVDWVKLNLTDHLWSHACI